MVRILVTGGTGTLGREVSVSIGTQQMSQLRANPDDPQVRRASHGLHGPSPGPYSQGLPGRAAIMQGQLCIVAVVVVLTPGGIGAREASMVGLLVSVTSTAAALSVVILNRERVDWIANGQGEEMATLDMPAKSGGRLLKDFTGELSG